MLEYKQLTRNQKIAFWLSMCFILAVILLTSPLVRGLDKWQLCSNINLTGQDCDDFWGNLTYIPELNLTNLTDNMSRMMLREEVEGILNNLTVNYSELLREQRFQELNNSMQQQLMQKDIELAQYRNKTYMEKADAISLIRNEIAAGSSSVKSGQQPSITGQTTNTQQSNFFQQNFILIVIIGAVLLYFGYEKFVKQNVSKQQFPPQQGWQGYSQQPKQQGKGKKTGVPDNSFRY